NSLMPHLLRRRPSRRLRDRAVRPARCGVDWCLRRAYGTCSFVNLLDSADAGREPVDVVGSVVEVEARAVRGCSTQVVNGRRAAVVAGADGDPVEVEELRHVVRMRAGDVEADDPGAAFRGRPVERDAGDLAELLEGVAGQRVLVGLDRLQA